MRSSIAALALLASGASAAAVPWIWDVTSFSSICSAATCRYSFNVSAPTGPSGQPSFDASFCFGVSVQGGYKACSPVGVDVPAGVQTREFNQGIDIGAVVSVRYAFTQYVQARRDVGGRGCKLICDKGEVRYTYTGNNSVAHTGLGPATDFQIIPTEVSAVA